MEETEAWQLVDKEETEATVVVEAQRLEETEATVVVEAQRLEETEATVVVEEPTEAFSKP
jgi:hypothetical protein